MTAMDSMKVQNASSNESDADARDFRQQQPWDPAVLKRRGLMGKLSSPDLFGRLGKDTSNRSNGWSNDFKGHEDDADKVRHTTPSTEPGKYTR